MWVQVLFAQWNIFPSPQTFNVFVCVYAFWETPPSVPAPAALSLCCENNSVPLTRCKYLSPPPPCLFKRSFHICVVLGRHTPSPRPRPLPKVDTGFFRRTQWSQERYESLMSDVTAPGRGNVLKTWLQAHGKRAIGGDRGGERGIWLQR